MSWIIDTIGKHYVKSKNFKGHDWKRDKKIVKGIKRKNSFYLAYECSCGAYFELDSIQTVSTKDDIINFWIGETYIGISVPNHDSLMMQKALK